MRNLLHLLNERDGKAVVYFHYLLSVGTHTLHIQLPLLALIWDGEKS